MNNAKRFNDVFGIYATELWAMPEKEFLEWLNAKADLSTIRDESFRINKAYDDGCKTGYEQARFDYEPKWIPVSERLPEENGEYLVTREAKGVYKYVDIVKKTNTSGDIASDIIAWMPLPEPWAGNI